LDEETAKLMDNVVLPNLVQILASAITSLESEIGVTQREAREAIEGFLEKSVCSGYDNPHYEWLGKALEVAACQVEERSLKGEAVVAGNAKVYGHCAKLEF
jgi:hypothetical protein